MKKIIKYFILLILLLPISVNADMGMPEVMGYYVTPKNLEGANYYDPYEDSDVIAGKIEYGEKVKVIFEMMDDDELIGQIEYKEHTYDIYLKDFITITEYYKPTLSDSSTEKVNYSIKVLDPDGIRMYKGPSEAYDKYDFVIPFGEEIKVEYDNADIWLYGEYNGTKAWFMSYYGSVGIIHKDEERPLVIAATVELKESLEADAKTLATIPALTEFSDYYQLDAWAWAYYVTYNGVSGYIDSETVLEYRIDENEKNIVGKAVTIYETAEEGAKKVGTLKPLKVFYIRGGVGNHWDYYYIESEDIKGYLINNYDELTIINEDDDYYSELLNGEITYEEYLNMDNEETDDEDDSEEYDDNEEYDDEEDEETEDDDEKEKTEKKSSSKKGMNAKDIVILCVGGAVIVALTAIVTIVLVNKRKKSSKKEDSAEIISNQEPTVVENQQPEMTNQIEQQVETNEIKENEKDSQ